MTVFYTLSRYFARTFLLWFFVFAMGILSVILLFDFSELVRRSASKPEITMGILTEMVFLQLPYLVEQLLPFIVLFSAMFALWKLNRQNEICVTRAIGVSVWQLLSPFMAIALLIGCVDLFVLNPISSTLLNRYKDMNAEHFRNEKGGISISETGVWFRHAGEKGPVILRIGYIDALQKKMSDISILEYNKDDTLSVRVDAKSATFVDGGLKIQGVWTYPVQSPPVFQKKGFYGTSLVFSNLQENNRAPESISFWALPKFIKLLEKSGLSSVKYRLYWQAMIARTLWLLAMVLLAATCTLQPLRSGRQFLFILPATVLGFSLYFLRDITYAMGQSSTLPVIFAAWVPVAISAMIGVVALLHTEEH